MGDDKENWDNIWESVNLNDNECVIEAVADNIGRQIKGAKILEAGSGIGIASLGLAKMGAEVTLSDYSEVAINKAKDIYKQSKIKAHFQIDDIRNMRFDSDVFDVVFNAGVLEHYDYIEQVKILTEMARVCRPGGRVIVMVPNARCILYRLWKWILEKQGQWVFGYEKPVETMVNQFRDADIRLISEFSIGFKTSLEQIGSIEEFKSTADKFEEMFDDLPLGEKALIDGYLLCCVGKKGNIY